DDDDGDADDDDDDDKDELELDDMEPSDDVDPSEDSTDAKSALDAVIDMMKADAEARKADAEAKTAESGAKIAALNTQAAEAQVKKSEEVMDMEAYYNKQSDKDKETKQLTKLAKYKHDLSNSDVEANTDYVETDITSEEVKVSGKFLNAALQSLLKQRN
ncbi:MAG: hypothetical protein KAJ73_03770, partial [Zetaproteobacteria bacterium]|nr:hypothetical protein [Zetaproteobacteria bacterium]